MDLDTRFCGHCGERLLEQHGRCEARLELEPPRYCAECRRRLIVQVLPTGYVARCSAHGELAQPSAAAGG
jgi:hypothetical protein